MGAAVAEEAGAEAGAADDGAGGRAASPRSSARALSGTRTVDAAVADGGARSAAASALGSGGAASCGAALGCSRPTRRQPTAARARGMAAATLMRRSERARLAAGDVASASGSGGGGGGSGGSGGERSGGRGELRRRAGGLVRQGRSGGRAQLELADRAVLGGEHQLDGEQLIEQAAARRRSLAQRGEKLLHAAARIAGEAAGQRGAERVRQLAGGGVALGGRGPQRPLEDGAHVVIEAPGQRERRAGGEGDGHVEVALRRVAGQEGVQGAAEGEDIGAAIDGAAGALLGGHEGPAARRQPGLGLDGAAACEGDAKIAELDVAGPREQHVGRLDVAVHDGEVGAGGIAGFVGVMQGVGDVGGDGEGDVGGQLAAAGAIDQLVGI